MRIYLLVLFCVGLFIGFAVSKQEYCHQLKADQYMKRQSILKKSLEDCGLTPMCLAQAIELTDFMVKFDNEVRKAEGCDE